MRHETSKTIAASLFFAAAAMTWLGWTLLPHKLGIFFHAGDFAAVDRSLHLWIWMYRFHLFGLVTAVMALVALGSRMAGSEARVLVWPGISVAAAGLMVTALAGAFYYHFGAWGAIDMRDRPPAEIEAFVASMGVATEYVTCLLRFGRVFFGLGQAVLGAGLLLGGRLPSWIAWVAVVLGVAAQALTMLLPDDLHLYAPIFHANALWLAAVGWSVLREKAAQ